MTSLSSCSPSADSNMSRDIPSSSANRIVFVLLGNRLGSSTRWTTSDEELVPGYELWVVTDTETVGYPGSTWNAVQRWSRELSLQSDSDRCVSVRTPRSGTGESMDAHCHERARVETYEDEPKWSVDERKRVAYGLRVVSRMDTTITIKNTNCDKTYRCKHTVGNVTTRYSG
jgi:hypothetical protein